MAAVEVTISGLLFDKVNRTTQNVVLIGEATLTGLGVGGGPIYPPPGGGGPPISPGVPTHPIMLPGMPGWGDPRPTHPIVLPDPPQVPPPTIWPPGPGIDVPEHPIVLPPPGSGPPDIPPGTLVTWKPVWTPDQGWMVVGVPNVPHPAPSGARPQAQQQPSGSTKSS